MNSIKFFRISIFILLLPLMLTSCKSPDGKFKLPGGDARKTPADPAKRVEQNLKDGRGFKLNDAFSGPKGGVFDFASSNELWRASLDTIDFMPLASVNYSGGIIVTDWYAADQSLSGESVKYCLERKILFKNLKIDELKKFHPDFDEDVFVNLEPLNVVKSRTSEGGTGFAQVEKEVKNWKKKLLL